MSMSGDEIRDTLAMVQASIDQAQSDIDYARKAFANDAEFQARLDLKQMELDLQQARVRTQRFMIDVLEPN